MICHDGGLLGLFPGFSVFGMTSLCYSELSTNSFILQCFILKIVQLPVVTLENQWKWTHVLQRKDLDTYWIVWTVVIKAPTTALASSHPANLVLHPTASSNPPANLRAPQIPQPWIRVWIFQTWICQVAMPLLVDLVVELHHFPQVEWIWQDLQDYNSHNFHHLQHNH